MLLIPQPVWEGTRQTQTHIGVVHPKHCSTVGVVTVVGTVEIRIMVARFPCVKQDVSIVSALSACW